MALEALKEWDLSRDNPLAKNGYHAYARSHRISWPNPKHIFNVTRRHLSYGYLTCEKKTKHTYGRQMQAIIMWPAANHPLVPGKWDIQISCYKLVPPTLLSWLISRLTRVYCRYVYTLMNLEPNNYSWLFIIYIYMLLYGYIMLWSDYFLKAYKSTNIAGGTKLCQASSCHLAAPKPQQVSVSCRAVMAPARSATPSAARVQKASFCTSILDATKTELETSPGVISWGFSDTRPGKHTKNYWTWQFTVDLPIQNCDFP